MPPTALTRAKPKILAVHRRFGINACSAKVLAANDQTRDGAGDSVFDWLLPVHSGEWLSLQGLLLSWSAALALITMAVSGYILWTLRVLRRSARLAGSARGRP